MAIPDSLAFDQDLVDNRTDWALGKTELKEENIDRLGLEKSQDLGIERNYEEEAYADGSGGYTDTGYGAVKNSNKWYNNLTGAQYDDILSKTIDRRGIQRDDNGNAFRTNKFGKKEYLKDQGTPSSFLYSGQSKDGSSVKDGLGRYGVEERYTPGLAEATGKRDSESDEYGWDSGAVGIDAENASMNQELIGGAASRLEKMKHGRDGSIANKVMFDDGSLESQLLRDEMGSGASEYTMNPGQGSSLDEVLRNKYVSQDKNYDEALQHALGSKEEDTSLDAKYVKDMSDTYNNMEGLTDKEKTSLWIEQKEADNLGWKGKAIHNMDEKELDEYYEMKDNDQLDQGYFSDDGTLMTGIMKTGSTVGQMVQTMADTGMETIVNGLELKDKLDYSLTEDKKLHYQIMRDAWNVNEKVWEKNLRVNHTWSKKASSELDNAMENGSNLDVVGAVLKNFDSYVADMAGETIALFSGVGTAAAINRRVQIQKEELQEVLGREPTSSEVALMTLTNGSSLLMEKLLFIPVIAKPFKYMLGKVTSKVTPSSKSIIANIAKRSMLVGGAALGEGVQEVYDQTQENFWKKGGADSPMAAWEKIMSGKVISAKEAKMAFAAGAVMSGAISGSTNTLGGLVDARAISRNKSQNQEQEDAGEFIAGEEQELATGLNEMSLENDINEANDRLDHADSSLEAAEDMRSMVGSVNRDVRDIAKNVILKQVEKSNSQDKEGYVKLVKRIVADQLGLDPDAAHDFLTKNFGVDTKDMTIDEINKLIDESSIEENDKLATILDPKSAGEAIISLVNESEFEAIKESAKEILTSKRKRVEEQREAAKRFNANYDKGKDASPEERKNEIVDSKKVKKAAKRGILGTIKDIVTLTNKGKQAAIRELNNYTNEALEKSLADPAVDEEVKKYIKDTQAKRKKASSRIGIDLKYFDSIDQLEVEKGNKAKTKNIISNLVKSKEILDTRVRDAAYELLNSALEQNIITDKQHELFSKRVKKISENALEPTPEQVNETKEANKKENVGPVEAANKEKIEVDLQDVNEQAAEQQQKSVELDSEIKALESKKTRTPEEETKLAKLKADLTALNTRKGKTASSILTLLEQEAMDGGYAGSGDISTLFTFANKENVTEYRTAEEAFTEEELAILGKICK